MKKLVELLLVGALSVTPLLAQNNNAATAPAPLQLAVIYDAARNGATPSFWLQGGSVQLEGRFWRGLGVVAEVNGLHTANMHGSGVGLDLVTATFGPRYTLQLHGIWPGLSKALDRKQRISLYGEVLAGEANGLHSVFPATGATTDSANSFALQVGGGVNYTLTRRLSVRALEADWQRTSLPNNGGNVQNNLRLGAGIVWNLSRERH